MKKSRYTISTVSARQYNSHTVFTLLLGLSFLFLFCSRAQAFNLHISEFTEVETGSFPRNGNVVYTISTENLLADIAPGVKMTFPIPTDTEFVALDDGGSGECQALPVGVPDRVECDYGDLLGTDATPIAGPRKNVLVTIRATIPNEIYVFATTAFVEPLVGDLDPSGNSVTQNTTVTDSADLTTTLSANPPTVIAGGDVVYTATVTNNGPNETTNDIDVIFQLSANVTYAGNSSAGWSCGYNAGSHQLSCSRTGTLNNGSSTPDITFTARVTEITGTITTTATIPPHDDDPIPNNNVTTNDVTVTQGTDVAVTISASPSSVIEGNTTTIWLRPRNNGPYGAETVELTYTIPAGFTIDTSPSGSGWTCDDTDFLPDIICSRTNYAPGSTDDISLVLLAPVYSGTSTFTNTVVITTTTPEAIERQTNNSDSTTVTLAQNGVNLSLYSKTKSPNPVAQGSLITSRILVRNYGPLPAASGTITVTDTLNRNQEEYASFSGTYWSCTPTDPALPADPYVTCIYNYSLNNGAYSQYLYINTTATATGLGAGLTSTLTNTAEVSYSGTPGDYDSANNTRGATVTVTNHIADLVVIKEADRATLLDTEDTITYTIDVCNNGPDAATGIRLTDPIAGYYNGAAGTTDITVVPDPGNTGTYTCSTGGTVVCNQTGGVRNPTLSDCTTPAPTDRDRFTVVVKRPLYDGSRTNTASAYSSDVGDNNRDNNVDSATVVVDSVADVRVQSKTVTPNPVKSGVEATYVITVRNDGPSTAANVKVIDTFTFDGSDTGFTFVSVSAPYSDYCSGLTIGQSYTNADTPTLTCEWDTISRNTARTLTMVIRPNYMVSPTSPREFHNSVEISTDTEDNNASNDTFGPVTLTIEQDLIDLIIDNDDTPDPLGHNPNSPATNSDNDVVYHIDLTNDGPSYATGVNVDFTMTPKDGKTVQFLCDEAGSSNSCGTAPDICAVTAGSNPVTGNVDGTSALTLNCDYGNLAASANGHRYLTFRMISEPDPTGDTHNTNAIIHANEFEPITDNNHEAEPTAVRGKVDLEVISKIATPANIDRTQAVDWTITVTNHGPSNSRITELTDNLATYHMLAYDEAPGWVKTRASLPDETGSCTITAGLLECDFGTIESGHGVTITLPVKVDGWYGSPMENCVTVKTFDVDSNLLNNSACGNVDINNQFHPSDYGDAPDTSAGAGPGDYATQLNYGGARHYLDIASAPDTPYLGSCVDADGNGTLQNASADADDVSGPLNPPLNSIIGACTDNGDEDGVQIPVLVAGRTLNLGVTVGGATCNFSGWVDFNQDGDWVDAGEQIVTDYPVTVGPNNVPISVPATISVGSSYARFRCATEIGLTPTGSANPTHPDYAADGEVEDYLVSLQPENAATYVDYGDAAGYRTTLAEDGASHILGVTGAPILGGCVDSDDGSLVNVEADADDTSPQQGFGLGDTFGICADTNDDEDGVTFSQLIAGRDATLGITITGGPCLLNGWIDYNNDGDWNDTGEQIFEDVPLTVGSHDQTISIPTDVAVADSYGRFRCSTSGGLSTIGAAVNGEVEDYQLPLLGYISGQVRMDSDDDADPADPDTGISGVTINLRNSSNTIIATTTTDSTGNYLFLGIATGDYTVEEVDPIDYVSTADTDNPNDNLINVTLDNDGSSVDNDFLDTHTSNLGDHVWFDTNRNGIQDIGEVGIAGVLVNLYNSPDTTTPTAATLTNGKGFYEFTGVRTGSYLLEFDKPTAYTFSTQEQGGNENLDSNCNVTTGQTVMIAVPPGTSNPTIDAGMYLTNGDLPAHLGNRVWYDTNHDGIQDAGEQGISGVSVALLDDTGSNTIGMTLTDGSGLYQFSGLAAGDYLVKFTKPAGFTISASGVGVDHTKDSDANTATGETAVITLVAGENNPDIDAGMYRANQLPARLGDFVWYDSNKDGIQETIEPGIGGVTVALFSAEVPDAAMATTLTSGDGGYSFEGLTSGNYVVHFELPGGYSYSPTAAVAATFATDSNADTTTGRSGAITLAEGEENHTIDAGLSLPADTAISIGDLVWLDNNYDGNPDAGEGVADVELVLYDLFGKEVRRTTTAGNGSYLFSELPPGDYLVKVETATLPSGAYQITDPDATLDSAHRASNIVADEYRDTVDFGYRYNNIIGDYVWFDENQDGIQDPSEAGIAGITVNLYLASDLTTIFQSAVTSGTGFYQFTNLTTADYQVEFMPPAGYTFSQADQGGGTLQDSFDSDVDPGTGRIPVFNLSDNEANLTLDAGLYLINEFEPASLGNFVWLDDNMNGILEPEESGAGGITVRLFDESFSVQLATAVTDGSGFYGFMGLTAGNYAVEFVLPAAYSFSPQDAGSFDSIDSDAGIVNGRTEPIILAAGDDYIDLDAGVFLSSEELPASLGDLVWFDTNNNGIQDMGESGVAGVSVFLYDAADLGTPLTSSVTDSGGNYIFSGLAAGDYIIRFEAPIGHAISPQNAGTPATDCDADPFTGYTATVLLAGGENNVDIDAGIYSINVDLFTIGDLVWLDRNHNEFPDSGEGLEYIEVVLYSLSGIELQRTATNGNGLYSFPDIPSGDYRVAVNTVSLPLDLIQIADPDSTFNDSHQLVELNADTDLVDFGYREHEVDVELNKSFSHTIDADGNSKISAGDTLTFTISLVNRGPETATGIVVTDQLPVGYTFKEATPSQGDYSEPLWTVGSLAVGGTATLHMKATVTKQSNYLNIASVTATNEYDIDSTPDNNIEEEDDEARVRPLVHNFPWSALIAAIPPCPPTPSYCYMVSDRDSTQMHNSALLKYNFEKKQVEMIGRLGVGDVEAITLSLDGQTLYAVDQGVFGIIDTTPGLTGSFTPVNTAGLGVGQGPLGEMRFTDIDGFAFDPTTGILYASARRADDLNGLDMLIKIDPSSGELIRHGFGMNRDYTVIDSGEYKLFHTDDIAIDAKGTMYGVVENSGGGGGDLLVIIDKQTGAVRSVGGMTNGSGTVQDMEGLTFYFRNTLFGTTGIEFSSESHDNSLFKINAVTGNTEKIIRLDDDISGFQPYDFEAISCPVCR